MKTKTLLFVAVGVYFFVFFALGYFLGAKYGYATYNLEDNKNVASQSTPQIDKCSNLSSVKLTSECLIKELTEFYIYNESNAELYWNKGRPNIENWDKIKQEGGVCWHFAEWYAMRAEQLGFNGRSDVVYYDDLPYNHAIAMITNNKNEYCLIDQLNLVGCGKTGIIEVENE